MFRVDQVFYFKDLYITKTLKTIRFIKNYRTVDLDKRRCAGHEIHIHLDLTARRPLGAIHNSCFLHTQSNLI